MTCSVTRHDQTWPSPGYTASVPPNWSPVANGADRAVAQDRPGDRHGVAAASSPGARTCGVPACEGVGRAGLRLDAGGVGGLVEDDPVIAVTLSRRTSHVRSIDAARRRMARRLDSGSSRPTARSGMVDQLRRSGCRRRRVRTCARRTAVGRSRASRTTDASRSVTGIGSSPATTVNGARRARSAVELDVLACADRPAATERTGRARRDRCRWSTTSHGR